MTLRAEAHHRSTGGARIVLRNEAGAPISELVLDSPTLAFEALDALAVAMGGGSQYGVLLTTATGIERVTEYLSERAAVAEAQEPPNGIASAVVSRSVGPWVTDAERGRTPQGADHAG